MLTPHACPPPLPPAPACAARALAHPHIITTYQHAVSEETVGEGRVHQQVRAAPGRCLRGRGRTRRAARPGARGRRSAPHHPVIAPPSLSTTSKQAWIKEECCQPHHPCITPLHHASAVHSCSVHSLCRRGPSRSLPTLPPNQRAGTSQPLPPSLTNPSAGVDHPGVCQPRQPAGRDRPRPVPRRPAGRRRRRRRRQPAGPGGDHAGDCGWVGGGTGRGCAVCD